MIFSEIKRNIRSRYKETDLLKPATWLTGGYDSLSSVTVTEEKALKFSPFFTAVRVLAETFGQLPCVLYEDIGTGRRKAKNHTLYNLLRYMPNPETTSAEWKETVMGHLATYGNHYSEIQYDELGRVVGLWQLRPDRMIEIKRGDDDKLYYIYKLPNGDLASLDYRNIFHVRLMGYNGINGYNLVSMLKDSIGLGIAQLENDSSFYENSAIPSGVLQVKKALTEKDDIEKIRKGWYDVHGGLDNKHRVAVLDEGTTWQEVGISNRDAQALETRQYTAKEIAGFLRIPAHLMGILDNATYSNIEKLDQGFIKHTMMPYFTKFELRVYASLLSTEERSRYYVEFLTNSMLRGDTKSRFEAYHTAKIDGWLSTDDIREMENLNPLPNGAGSGYWMPVNVIDSKYSDDYSKKLSFDNSSARALRGVTISQILNREKADIMRQKERTGELDSEWLDGFFIRYEQHIKEKLLPVLIVEHDIDAESVVNEFILERRAEINKLKDADIDTAKEYYENLNGVKNDKTNI